VYNANDEYLGQLIGVEPNLALLEIYIPAVKKVLSFDTQGGENNFWESIYFTSNNCDGTPYTLHELVYLPFIITANINATEVRHYFIDYQPTRETWLSRINRAFPYNCLQETGTDSLGMLHEVSLPFTYPVPLPFRFEY
jgi:hypothetical protein